MSDGNNGKPDDITLTEIITGEGAEIFWLPEARSPEQKDAKANLALALQRFERVFGQDCTIRQLALFISTTKMITRKNAALRRAKAARTEINRVAAEHRANGNLAEAAAAESMPTPHYPEKAADEEELGYEL